MSTSTPAEDGPRALSEPPEFELSFRFDDVEEPTEVTVFPDRSDDQATEWISIETGYALPIEETR